MDIKNFDIRFIDDFSRFYNLADFKFGKKIKTQNTKKQNKIRNWIDKNCINIQEYPENVIEQLKNLNDNEFISFLKSCLEYIDLNGSALEQQINKTCKDFSDSVKKSFFHLFDREFYFENDFEWSDNNIELTVDSSVSYEEKLILSDAKYSTDKKFDSLSFYDNCSLVKENNIYILTGEAYSDKEDEPFEMSITFTSAKTEIKIFNPITISPFVSLTPWDQLLNISISIIAKEDFENSLNKSEIELMPLLKDIKNSLFLYSENTESFTNFKALISKHKYFELLPTIKKIESPHTSEKRKNVLSQRLINKLNLIKYKPLWQEIFDLLKKSQKEYPTYIETKKTKGTITKFRNKVKSIMYEHGYSGEYPNFYKQSSLKGIHLIDSYNITYTVAFEKNAVHHIHCEEKYDTENGIYLTFFYGTEFLKRGEAIGNINSCRFNCKGKKYVSSVIFNADFEENQKLSLEEKIRIVVKKAEFKKLSKEENSKIFNSFSFSDKFAVFLITSLFFGFLFATMFIPAMMALSAFLLWIDGMPVIISDIPWLIMYFATWILFGIPMGIVTVCSKK